MRINTGCTFAAIAALALWVGMATAHSKAPKKPIQEPIFQEIPVIGPVLDGIIYMRPIEQVLLPKSGPSPKAGRSSKGKK